GRASRDLRSLADTRAREKRAARADPGVRTDPDVSDVDGVAVHPVPGHLDLGLDAGAAAQLDEAGHRRRRAQVDVLGDPRAQRRPTRPIKGIISAVWITPARRGAGFTSRRSEAWPSSSSSIAASAPSFGCW